MKRNAVFISGRGSNLKSLLDEKCLSTTFVFANKQAPGLKWAQKRGVYTEVFNTKSENFWDDFADRLNKLKVRRVFLLGFMKIVPEVFIKKVTATIVNIHPSVLPEFPGLHSLEKTYEHKKAMGCTLHYVSPEVDMGKKIRQKAILNFQGNLTEFSYRVHDYEKKIIVEYAKKG